LDNLEEFRCNVHRKRVKYLVFAFLIMDKCPVCGMEVEESTSLKTMYRGKVYRFCSDGCKNAFTANPNEYIKGGPKGMPGHHTHHDDCNC